MVAGVLAAPSECASNPSPGQHRSTARARAATTSRLSRWSAIDQPTTRRAYRSSTAARYSQPSRVGMEVLSATHAAFGDSGANCRPSRLSATGRSWLESVVQRNFRAILAAMPFCCIRRPTVFTQQSCPRAASSACPRGLP